MTRLVPLLVIVFGIFEWMVRRGRLPSRRAALIFPVLCVVGGGMLLSHSHAAQNLKDELLLEVTHAPLGLLALLIGWGRWLELRLPEGAAARPGGALGRRARAHGRAAHYLPGKLAAREAKIEHRLFSFISQNWRGQPLLSHAVIVNLIAATTTTTGLRVRARVGPTADPSGLKVSRASLEAVRLRPDAFHVDWNYTTLPTPPAKR